MERTTSFGDSSGPSNDTERPQKKKNGEKLEILLSVYSGPVKETLRGCLQLEDPIAGDQTAWDILDKRHGDKYIHKEQLKKKVLVGPAKQLSDLKCLK